MIHLGGYIAKFEISWDEISVDENGEESVITKYWDRNRQDLYAPFSTNIELPGNAHNIRVIAWENTGKAWSTWRRIIDSKEIPLIAQRKFKISGTQADPIVTVTPEI